LLKEQSKNGLHFKQGNFDTWNSELGAAGVHLVGYAADYPLWTAWEEPGRHCRTLLSTTSPSGGSNPANLSRSTTRSDSSVWQRLTTHCRHDKSTHSGTRLGLEILPHPPYSPNLAPSDCHHFRSLSNNLRAVSFNDAELQNWLDVFTAKPANFFKRGIENLPERWEAVVHTGGEYIIDRLFDYSCEK
jgi:hypothetical protein